MKVMVPHLGELLLGRTYEVTFSDGRTNKWNFVGAKINPRDGKYSLYLAYADGPLKGSEIGFNLTNIVIMDLVN